MELKELGEAWREQEREVPIEAELTFQDAGLVLGAGAVLAAADEDGRMIRLTGGEVRLLTLLSVAYDRKVGPEVLGPIRRASIQRRDGDDAMASMHLAMTRLGRMPRPREAARRLFLADRLLEAGTEPATILRAAGLDAAATTLERAYNPDQPRAPAGNSIQSGRWTSGDGSGADAAPPSEAAAPDDHNTEERSAPTAPSALMTCSSAPIEVENKSS